VEERFADAQADKDAVATAVEVQYVWSARYIDAPVLRDRDADGQSGTGLEERLYYTTDANMNVTALMDAAGHIAERYVYDPYGSVTVYSDDWSTEVTTWANSKQNSIRYCGYFFDNETSLYHVRHRYYHPSIGRWLCRDKTGYKDGLSFYNYLSRSPVSSLDPFGFATGTTDGDRNDSDYYAMPDPNMNKPKEESVRARISVVAQGLFTADAKLQVKFTLQWSPVGGHDDQYGSLVRNLAGDVTDPNYSTDPDHGILLMRDYRHRGGREIQVTGPYHNRSSDRENVSAVWRALPPPGWPKEEKVPRWAELAAVEYSVPLCPRCPDKGSLRLWFWYSDVFMGPVDQSAIMGAWKIDWSFSRPNDFSYIVHRLENEQRIPTRPPGIRRINDNVLKRWDKEIMDITKFDFGTGEDKAPLERGGLCPIGAHDTKSK
jgi:RHS repeat-associated protein